MMFANPPPPLFLLFDLIYLHMEKFTCPTKDFNTPSFNLPIPHCTHTHTHTFSFLKVFYLPI